MSGELKLLKVLEEHRTTLVSSQLTALLPDSSTYKFRRVLLCGSNTHGKQTSGRPSRV